MRVGACPRKGERGRGWQARNRITDALEHRYGYFGMTNLAAVPVAGTVDDCVAGLHEVAAAGAQVTSVRARSLTVSLRRTVASSPSIVEPSSAS
jgi:hypothetical protein